jgi:hypothetical protein
MINLPHYAKYIYFMHIPRNSINIVSNDQFYNDYRPAIPFVNLYPIGSAEVMPKSLHH